MKAEPESKSIGGLVENLPFNQLPMSWVHPMGGIPVVFRSGIIRIALAKLQSPSVGALVAIRATNADAAFVPRPPRSTLWRVRTILHSVACTRSAECFLDCAGRTKTGEWVGRRDRQRERKMFLQEFVVDAAVQRLDCTRLTHILRLHPLPARFQHNVLLLVLQVTLVFLVLDLMDLTYHATGGVQPFNVDGSYDALDGVLRWCLPVLRKRATRQDVEAGEQELDIDCAQILWVPCRTSSPVSSFAWL